MDEGAKHFAGTVGSAHAHRFFLLALVSGGYFAASMALFAMSGAGVIAKIAGLPASMLVILACMLLSVASTACYVLLKRAS